MGLPTLSPHLDVLQRSPRVGVEIRHLSRSNEELAGDIGQVEAAAAGTACGIVGIRQAL